MVEFLIIISERVVLGLFLEFYNVGWFDLEVFGFFFGISYMGIMIIVYIGVMFFFFYVCCNLMYGLFFKSGD